MNKRDFNLFNLPQHNRWHTASTVTHDWCDNRNSRQESLVSSDPTVFYSVSVQTETWDYSSAPPSGVTNENAVKCIFKFQIRQELSLYKSH